MRASAVAVLVALSASFHAMAQSTPANVPAVRPEPAPVPGAETPAPTGGFAIGGFRLLPTLGLSFGYDDNVTLAPRDEQSSTFAVVSPGVRLEGGNARRRLAFFYEGEYGHYFDSPRDDYVDHRLGADFRWRPKLRHGFALDALFARLHDARGTGAREGELGLLPLDADRYRREELGGNYVFGAPGARGRLQAEARFGRSTYTNNREFTAFRDRDDGFLAGEFGARLGAKTGVLVRVEHGRFDYRRTNLDNDERHLYAGLTFDATAKTSGSILVGWADKRFDDPAREDFSGVSWRVGLKYRPRSYSVFDLGASRDTDETNGFGDYILREDLTAGWSYNWSERFRTTVDVGFAREEHRPEPREDELFYYGVSADYLFRRWLRFGASWRGYQRDSRIDSLAYDRNLFLLSAEIAIR